MQVNDVLPRSGWCGIVALRLGGDMDLRLIDELRQAEHSILEELRATGPYQRLRAVRQVLALYEAPPPVGALLDALLADPPHGARPPEAMLAAVISLPGPHAEVA